MSAPPAPGGTIPPAVAALPGMSQLAQAAKNLPVLLLFPGLLFLVLGQPFLFVAIRLVP